MAKTATSPSLAGELFAFNLYKRNQGRRTRQLTLLAIVVAMGFGAWSLSVGPLQNMEPMIRLGIPLLVVALTAWLAFRLVNYPRFADFLIEVEGEMAKVSWASRGELYRATVVVLVTMFFLGASLFIYDVLWQAILRAIGILRI